MSLKLEPLSASVLTNMEFGQLMNRHESDLATIASALLTVASYNNYRDQINAKSAIYQAGLTQVQKNEETERIALLDETRDKAVEAFSRALKLYEISDIPAEVEASRIIGIVFKQFKNLAKLNYEAESISIDQLVRDLDEGNYPQYLDTLNMGKYITRMNNANQDFKALFGDRMVVEASTETYNVKVIRKELQDLYNDFTDYVFAMAKTIDAPPLFGVALDLLNTARKYYADMLARRQGVADAKDKPAA